jgi:hypothetical protein
MKPLLIIVKIFPQIIQISVWWFVAIAVLCAPRLFYVLWIKKNGQQGAAPNGGPATQPGNLRVTERPPSVSFYR